MAFNDSDDLLAQKAKKRLEQALATRDRKSVV